MCSPRTQFLENKCYRAAFASCIDHSTMELIWSLWLPKLYPPNFRFKHLESWFPMLVFPTHFLSFSTHLCYSFGISIFSVFCKHCKTVFLCVAYILQLIVIVIAWHIFLMCCSGCSCLMEWTQFCKMQSSRSANFSL